MRHGSERKFFVKLKQRGFTIDALPVEENHADFRGEAHPRLFRIARIARVGAPSELRVESSYLK
jgi:hypothetical protein